MTKERLSLSLFEKEKKLEKVWKTYQNLSKRFKRVYIVKGEGSTEEVFSKVKSIVHSKLDF